MNLKSNPRHIMRILALALSLILVFSGITVFYAAEGEGGTGALSSDTDVQSDEGASPRVTTPGDASDDASEVTAHDDASDEDDKVPSDGDSEDGDEFTSPGDASDEEDEEEEVLCPMCGSENYDSLYEVCFENFCHEHDEDLCSMCEECGGCTDNLYGDWCFKGGRRCTPCECFDLIALGMSSFDTYTVDEVTAMKGKDEVTVRYDDITSGIYALTKDGKTVALDDFLTDYGAKITKRQVTMDPKYNIAVMLNFVSGDTERFSYAFTNSIAAGNSIPINVSMTVEHDGITREIERTHTIYITDGSDDHIKKIDITEGSESLVLEVGETAEVVYTLTMDEEYENSFNVSLLATGMKVIDAFCERDLDKSQCTVFIEALEPGKSDVIITFYEGDSIMDAVDPEKRTIKVEVVENDETAAHKNSASFEKNTAKPDEYKLIINGWYDGDTLEESDHCYLPAGWTMTSKKPVSLDLPDGGASDADMKGKIMGATAYSDLPAGNYTARVTFQGYERKADGWYPVAGDERFATANLKVEGASTGGNTDKPDDDKPGNTDKPGSNNNNNNNSSNNNSDGNTPGTGDIIRENPGVKAAGIVMLIAGLLIFGTLAAERVYREMQARKRQAEAVRR